MKVFVFLNFRHDIVDNVRNLFVLPLPHGILGFGKCPLIKEIKYTNI